MPSMLDAVVVGAGPNGLTAAVELARRGFSVAVFEARETVGGGARTEELTLPGFRHDPCSAAHPLGINSPAFRALRREIDASDLRRPRLIVTPAGRKAMTRGLDLLSRAFATRLGRLGAAEQSDLKALLEKLS